MKQSQAKQVLLKASTIWTSQPTDEAIQAEWAECLSHVSFEGALHAVRGLRDSGRPEPPTPGEIFKLAREFDDRREADVRRKQRLLEEPARTPEQIAAARNLVADFEKRVNERIGSRRRFQQSDRRG
jgi:hypothetical protein